MDRPVLQQYEIQTKVVASSGQSDTNCNSLLVINTGSCAATFENITLQPGQSFNVEGNRNEILVKTISWLFPDGGTNPQLSFVFKRYV